MEAEGVGALREELEDLRHRRSHQDVHDGQKLRLHVRTAGGGHVPLGFCLLLDPNNHTRSGLAYEEGNGLPGGYRKTPKAAAAKCLTLVWVCFGS